MARNKQGYARFNFFLKKGIWLIKQVFGFKNRVFCAKLLDGLYGFFMEGNPKNKAFENNFSSLQK
jgi:hypothetical protein